MEIVADKNVYASGGQRLLAWFIDKLVIGAFISLFTPWHLHFWYHHIWSVGFGAFWGLRWLVMVIYYALMESSSKQATIGKIVMGIKVTDINGRRLDMSKALLRNLSKILSGMLLGIGYIMILFDNRRQGLHDKIADTLVVNAE